MPNLRIVTKNALRQAASLTASSTAGNLAVSSLAAAVKSSLHRFTSTNGSYRATWAAPARIGCVALPFCNWSPTAKQRVRVSKEKSATNLQVDSERFSAWNKRGACAVAPYADVAPDGTRTMALLTNVGSPSVDDIFRSNARRTENAGARIEPSIFIKRVSTVGTLVIQHPDGSPYGRWQVNLAKLGDAVERVTRNHPAVAIGVEFTVSPSGGNGLHFFSYSLPALSVYLWGAQLELGTVSTSYVPSRDTFTSRASIGTYIGSDGLIKTAAVNEARMQYDPANPLAPAKLLLEPAATNYMPDSGSFGTGWSGSIAVTASSETYRGIPYMALSKTTNVSSQGLSASGGSVAAGGIRTLTIALRAGSSDKVSVGIFDSLTGGSGWGSGKDSAATVLEGPGTQISSNGGLFAFAGLSPTTDTIIQVTRMFLAAGTCAAYIYPDTSGSTTAGASILATRVQVEDGSIATGPELVTNGLFTTDASGWTQSNGTLSINAGKLRVATTAAGTTGRAWQNFATVSGRKYRITARLIAGDTSANMGLSLTGGSSIGLTFGASVSSGTVDYIYTFVATGPTTSVVLYNGSTVAGLYAEFDNVSCTEFDLVPTVTSYIPTTTAAATRAADVYTSAPGVRPDGYIDHWQSYDYDSGWVLACPAPAIELEGFTPAQAASAYAYGGGAYAQHWLPQQMDATGLAVDIADPDNLQGYIEAACLVAGPVWSPKYNASATSVSVIDRTEISRSAAGDQLVDPGTMSRKVSVDLRKMSPADRAKFLDLLRNSRAYPVLLSVFPEHADLELERDHMLYGRRTKDSDIAYQFSSVYSTTFEIEEI